MQVPAEGLTQKLTRLSQSQQSIESVSSFCIFYHKDAKGVVHIWETEFYKAPPDRKLALLYLANHILQEGRKKSTGFQEAFFRVLPQAIAHVSKHGDDKARRAATRLVTVWEERRVFGSRHIKSFRELLGPAAAPAGGGGSGSGSGRGAPAAAAAAAAAGDGAVSKLGPVGPVLAQVLQQAAAATSRGNEFGSSWTQDLLTSAGLPEVTAAHGKLAAFTAALQQELSARQAAVTTLTAELAVQNAELARVQGQLQSTGHQAAELQARMALLTSQMASAVASLGQLASQNGAAGAAAAVAATPPRVVAAPAAGAAAGEAGDSPQAPDLELEDDETAGRQAPAQPVQPAQQAPGQPPQQQQPQPPGFLSDDLQALLQNPAMLSAAISGATGMSAAATPPPGQGLGDGLSLGGDLFGGAGGYGGGLLPGSLGFGGFGLEQQQSGFADEGDDPYDPEHPD